MTKNASFSFPFALSHSSSHTKRRPTDPKSRQRQGEYTHVLFDAPFLKLSTLLCVSCCLVKYLRVVVFQLFFHFSCASVHSVFCFACLPCGLDDRFTSGACSASFLLLCFRFLWCCLSVFSLPISFSPFSFCFFFRMVPPLSSHITAVLSLYFPLCVCVCTALRVPCSSRIPQILLSARK